MVPYQSVLLNHIWLELCLCCFQAGSKKTKSGYHLFNLLSSTCRVLKMCILFLTLEKVKAVHFMLNLYAMSQLVDFQIRGMPFIFETNPTLVKIYLDSIAETSQTEGHQLWLMAELLWMVILIRRCTFFHCAFWVICTFFCLLYFVTNLPSL